MICRTTDSVSRTRRSAIMRAVRSRGNRGTEITLIRILRHHKITGWRRHLDVFGNPDFIFKKSKLALFVDGCFWHGCSQHCRMPKTNCGYWRPKITSNKRRDRSVNRALKKAGWRVVRIWEHELTRKNQHRCIARLCRILSDDRTTQQAFRRR